MIKFIQGAGIALVAAGVVALAWGTMPPLHPNNCTPGLIEKYTMDIISHEDCLALPRCVVEPNDVRRYNYSKLNFNQCVAQVLEDVKARKEEEAKE